MIIDETFTDAKSEAEREIYSTTEKKEYSQEYNSDEPMVFILDDLNEKEINVPKNKARFKQSRHNNVSIIIINQDYYDFPGGTVRANTNIYHILNSNNFRDVQNLRLIFQGERSGVVHNFTMDKNPGQKQIKKIGGGVQRYRMESKKFISNISFILKN